MDESKPFLVLAKDEIKKLLELYDRAKTTPMIKMTADPNEKDFATLAWDDVRELQIELGKKYHYDWQKVNVNKKGECFKIDT